jgi:phage FluMu protein Com
MSKKVKKKVKQKNKNKNVKEKQQLDTVVKEKSENGELPITDEEYQANQKDSKKKLYLLYMIPLGIAIVLAIVYILLRGILWLILFSIVAAVVVFGWDTCNRTCPRCKKWNSVSWVEYKKVERTTNIKVKSFLGRGKTKDKVEKIRKSKGRCTHCNHTFEKESKSFF